MRLIGDDGDDDFSRVVSSPAPCCVGVVSGAFQFDDVQYADVLCCYNTRRSCRKEARLLTCNIASRSSRSVIILSRDVCEIVASVCESRTQLQHTHTHARIVRISVIIICRACAYHLSHHATVCRRAGAASCPCRVSTTSHVQRRQMMIWVMAV